MNERLYMAMRLLGVDPELSDDTDTLRRQAEDFIRVALEDFTHERQRIKYSNTLMTNRCRMIAVFAREWYFQSDPPKVWHYGPLSSEKLEPGMLIREKLRFDEPPQISVLVAIRDYGPGYPYHEWVPFYDPEKGSAVCSSGSLVGKRYDYCQGIASLLKTGKYPALWQGERRDDDETR